MPRDPRPFVTYPINYTSHPRVEGMSDPAFRVWHSMMDYSRVHGLDGRIPQAIAEKRWAKRVLLELVTGIDDRPLVSLSAGVYSIRSYEEHQFTTGDARALSEKRANAGRAGGKATANAKQGAGNRPANARANGWQNEAESESELKLDPTDRANPSGASPEIPARDSEPLSEITQQRAHRAGIKNLAKVTASFEAVIGTRVAPLGAVLLVEEFAARANGPIRNVEAYIATVCSDTPDDVRWQHDRLDIAALEVAS